LNSGHLRSRQRPKPLSHPLRLGECHLKGRLHSRFLVAFRARDGVDLQMDALLCQIDAKLHRTINLAQSRARSRAGKRDQKTKKPHRDTQFFSSIAQMSKRFKAPRAHYVVKSQVCIAKSTIIILQLCNVLATMNKTTKIKTGHNFFVRSDGIQYKFRVSHEIAH
jgi:hypothetical protein